MCIRDRFITDNYLIEYSFSVDLGKFLEVDYSRKILSEQLKINDRLIFERNGELKFDSLDTISTLLVNAFEQNADLSLIHICFPRHRGYEEKMPD